MTDKRRMQDFNTEFIQNVEKYADVEECSTKDAFTSVFLEQIDTVSTAEFKLQDVEVVSYRNDSKNMRINGYASNAEFNTVTIIVSDYSDSSELETMGKVEAEQLLRYGANFYVEVVSGFFEDAVDYSKGAEIAEAILSEVPSPERVHVILLTNKIVKRFELGTVQRKRTTIQYDIWDIERIFEDKGTSEIVIDFEKYGDGTLSLIRIPENSELYDCYVGVISGETLANIYEIEDYRLFEKNIRVFLKYSGKINQGIRDTIKTSPEMFVAYNNGISTIADSIEMESEPDENGFSRIKKIHGWQIVNGAQTTSTIYNVHKSGANLAGISVQMKLVVIRDTSSEEEKRQLINHIALYANSQNPIKKSDFSAMEEYPQTMCAYSTKVGLMDSSGKKVYPWYYENARGGYDAYKNSRCSTDAEKKAFEKKTKKLTKTVAAKANMLWIAEPRIAAKGVETSYNEFMEMIHDGIVPSKPTEEDYKTLIVRHIIFQSCDKIIKREAFGDWKAQQVCYTIALLAKYHSDMVDYEVIWQNQVISSTLAEKICQLSYVVWDYFMSLDSKTNIGQWCKREECWEELQKYYGSQS